MGTLRLNVHKKSVRQASKNVSQNMPYASTVYECQILDFVQSKRNRNSKHNILNRLLQVSWTVLTSWLLEQHWQFTSTDISNFL